MTWMPRTTRSSARDAEVLYPGILKMAGRLLNGSGVAVALSLAVAEHIERPDYGPAAAAFTVLLIKLLPGFVTALVDDEQVRTDALATLRESGRR
ncbi:hypothetical protein [Streptomyces murinus]|uniref:hypothetical protein n=1 Tax=Streptomyces murinus TaxID=33900 RepID=UPI0038211520